MVIVAKDHGAQGGQAQIQGMGIAVHGPGIGKAPPQIAKITAAIDFRITVENFSIPTLQGHTNSITLVGVWGEITYNYQPALTFLVSAHEADNTVTVIVTMDPLKTIGVEILPPESRL